MNFFDEVLLAVVDCMHRSEFDSLLAFVTASARYNHLQTKEFAKRDCHCPDPARAAMNEDPVTVGGKTPLEQIHPHCKESFRHRRGLG